MFENLGEKEVKYSGLWWMFKLQDTDLLQKLEVLDFKKKKKY